MQFAAEYAVHYGRKRGRHCAFLDYDLGAVLSLNGFLLYIARQRGDRGAVDQRQADVAGHYCADTGIDCGTKRNELNRIEPCASHIDLRQPAMRVSSRVAMPGKVLGGGHHAAVLRAFDKGGDETADLNGI